MMRHLGAGKGGMVYGEPVSHILTQGYSLLYKICSYNMPC